MKGAMKPVLRFIRGYWTLKTDHGYTLSFASLESALEAFYPS